MQAYLFPGQGSQKANMGRSICQTSKKAAEVYKLAQRITGYDLLNASEQDLAGSLYAQLSIVTMSLACWEAWKETALCPEDIGKDDSVRKEYNCLDNKGEEIAFAGFSLGEYSVLGAAGILDYTSLFRLVSKRAELMEKAARETHGSMFAVLGLAAEVIEETLAESQFANKVYPVNYNAPGQLVISGEADATSAAAKALKAKGAKRTVQLNVSGSFHTKLMQPAADELKAFAEELEFKQVKARIYSNITGRLMPDLIDWPEYLADHMCKPVLWTDEIEQIRNDGYRDFIEIGYGKVLNGLAKKIDRNIHISYVECADSLRKTLTDIK